MKYTFNVDEDGPFDFSGWELFSNRDKIERHSTPNWRSAYEKVKKKQRGQHSISGWECWEDQEYSKELIPGVIYGLLCEKSEAKQTKNILLWSVHHGDL